MSVTLQSVSQCSGGLPVQGSSSETTKANGSEFLGNDVALHTSVSARVFGDNLKVEVDRAAAVCSLFREQIYPCSTGDGQPLRLIPSFAFLCFHLEELNETTQPKP